MDNKEEQKTENAVNQIANAEAREENNVEGATQEKADFTQMFGVASEEPKTEPPKKEIPIKLEPKEEETTPVVTLTDEEKKNNRQANFNQEERLLYKIEPEKTGSPIVPLLFFVVLIVFVFMLPTIASKYDVTNYFKGGTSTTTEEVPEAEEEQEYYELNKVSVKVVLDELELINFVKSKSNDDYLLTFTLRNISEKAYQYDRKYYISLYDNNKRLLYRALIFSYDAVAAKSSTELSLIISERAHSDAVQFKVEEIEESRYPEVSLSETDGEYGVLTCTYNYDEMKYYFLDGNLEKIKETYKESKNGATNYDSDKSEQKTFSNKLSSIENINSTFVESEGEFTLINEFNLGDISDTTLSNLKVYRYFKYNVSKEIVNFEIEAQGYNCS